MAKSLSQYNMEEDVKANEGSEVNSDDVEIAFRMFVDLLDNGGLKVIRDAIDQSQDPAQVVGQFLAQSMGQLAEQLYQQYQIDPKIFLAKNGWLDLVLDYIETELGYPPEFSDQIYAEVLEIVKAAASTPDAPNRVMEGGNTDPNAIANSQGAVPPQPNAPAMPAQGGAGMPPQAGMV